LKSPPICPERELEIIERAGLAFHHDAAVEDAAAMLQAALERISSVWTIFHCFLLARARSGHARDTARQVRA